MLLQALRRVEARGARELPHSLLEACGQTFRYGIATGRCDRNSAADLRGALRPVLTEHMAAILEPKEVRELMLAIRGYHGQLTTRAALYGRCYRWVLKDAASVTIRGSRWRRRVNYIGSWCADADGDSGARMQRPI